MDEARLKAPSDFELAIRRLGRLVATAKDRTHITITGRTHAWRPKSDFDYCTKHFPLTPKNKCESDKKLDGETHDQKIEQVDIRSTTSPFRILTLAGLSSDQIEVFSKARSVTDTKQFLDAIERADAWNFTSRPPDLEELIQFWREKKRIGSRLELMQASIDRRLTERDPDRADARPLSMHKARTAAKLIAAATTFCRQYRIRLPDAPTEAIGISILAVLPDWDERDQAALLARPIFDEAIYGTVRFHHRSVREYLTAEWLNDLLQRQTSRRKIESLLFQNQYGIDVIVPTARPILPWLALFDEAIRRRIRKIAPEIFFEDGDPSRLPIDLRRVVLREACAQLASGASERSMADYSAIQRFAGADLTPDVRKLLERYADNDDVISFLLRMVWQGQLTDALPDLKQIALAAATPHYSRIAALRAVKSLGSAQDRKDVQNAFLIEAPQLPRDLIAEFVDRMEPSQENIRWLLDCLEKSEPKDPHTIDKLGDAIIQFVALCDLDSLPQLISGFKALLDLPPVIERRYCEVSQHFLWLTASASTAVERLVRDRHLASLQPDALDVLRKFGAARFYADYDSNRDKLDLANLVPAWEELNRASFWYGVHEARQDPDQKKRERLTEFWQISLSGSFWRFSADDFDYAIDQIGAQPLLDDKLVALSLAFQLYVQSDRPDSWKNAFKNACKDNEDLSEKLTSYLQPPPQSEESRTLQKQESAWKRKAKARELRETENKEKAKQYLSEHPDKLRNPGFDDPSAISQYQWYLHEEMRGQESRAGRWTNGHWRSLTGGGWRSRSLWRP